MPVLVTSNFDDDSIKNECDSMETPFSYYKSMEVFWTCPRFYACPCYLQVPENHWSCIAHLNAEDMLKSAVIEEKKFKHSPRVGGRQPIRAKILMSTRRPHHYGHLLQV